MALGLLMPLTPADTRLAGYITVATTTLGIQTIYGFSDGSVAPAFGSVSGAASADLFRFFWSFGNRGDIEYTTGAFVGGEVTFMGVTRALVASGSKAHAYFSPESISNWPNSGTHPFYVELP